MTILQVRTRFWNNPLEFLKLWDEWWLNFLEEFNILIIHLLHVLMMQQINYACVATLKYSPALNLIIGAKNETNHKL